MIKRNVPLAVQAFGGFCLAKIPPSTPAVNDVLLAVGGYCLAQIPERRETPSLEVSMARLQLAPADRIDQSLVNATIFALGGAMLAQT